jgi:hypothetical protein
MPCPGDRGPAASRWGSRSLQGRPSVPVWHTSGRSSLAKAGSPRWCCTGERPRRTRPEPAGGISHFLNQEVPGVGEAAGEGDDLRVFGDLQDLSHERLMDARHPVCELAGRGVQSSFDWLILVNTPAFCRSSRALRRFRRVACLAILFQEVRIDLRGN